MVESCDMPFVYSILFLKNVFYIVILQQRMIIIAFSQTIQNILFLGDHSVYGWKLQLTVRQMT